MLGVAGRGIGSAAATIDKDENEDEGKNQDRDPLQTWTPDIMMICNELLETVAL